jgi:predicted lipoprotein with Yx(FWY)xxD motif
VKRVLTTSVCGAMLIAGGATLALASGNPAVQLRSTSKGKILVNSRGFTVYAFTADKRNTDNCVKKTSCINIWPIVRPGTPLSGSGIKRSLIGTITVKGHGKQLTYAGWPLYTYTQDTKPGETRYVNILQFGGHWPALNAAGGLVK